jgi:hypothetical protein
MKFRVGEKLSFGPVCSLVDLVSWSARPPLSVPHRGGLRRRAVPVVVPFAPVSARHHVLVWEGEVNDRTFRA